MMSKGTHLLTERKVNKMKLETRYYDSGKVYVRLFKNDSEVNEEYDSDKYDRYVETIGEGCDYESLEQWVEELEIELDDVVPLNYRFRHGKVH